MSKIRNKAEFDPRLGEVNPNILINGDFGVWQRGTSFTGSPIAAGYRADRWRFSGFDAISYTKHSLAAVGANKAAGVCNFTSNRNDNVMIDQPIENGNILLRGKTVTLSFVIDTYNGAAPSDTISVFQIINTEGSKAYNTVAIDYKVHPQSSGWYIGTATMTLPTFFDNTTSEHATLRLVVPPQGKGWISEVKLELGTEATLFIPDDPATNLVKCQRYYQTGAFFLRAVAPAAGRFVRDIRLATPMRVVPVVSYYEVVTSGMFIGVNPSVNSHYYGRVDALTTSSDFLDSATPANTDNSIGMSWTADAEI